jgi:hypothetical protein
MALPSLPIGDRSQRGRVVARAHGPLPRGIPRVVRHVLDRDLLVACLFVGVLGLCPMACLANVAFRGPGPLRCVDWRMYDRDVGWRSWRPQIGRPQHRRLSTGLYAVNAGRWDALAERVVWEWVCSARSRVGQQIYWEPTSGTARSSPRLTERFMSTSSTITRWSRR